MRYIFRNVLYVKTCGSVALESVSVVMRACVDVTFTSPGKSGNVNTEYITNKLWTWVRKCLYGHEGLFGVYCPSCEATREINIKIRLASLPWQYTHSISYVT